MFTYEVQEKPRGLSTQWFSHDHFGKRPRHLPAPIHHSHWVLITQRALGARLCFDSKVIFQRILNPLLQLPAQGGEGSSWKLKQLKLCSLQRCIEEPQLKQVYHDLYNTNLLMSAVEVMYKLCPMTLLSYFFSYFKEKHSPKIVYSLTIEKIIDCT